MEPEASGDVGYWVSNKLEAHACNGYMLKLFDARHKGTSIDVDPDFFNAVHPDDVSDLRAQLKAATQDGARFTTEYRLVCRDDTELHIKASGGQFTNGDGSISLIGTCVNITDLKQLRAADMKQMLHEQGLWRTTAPSCSTIKIAAFPDSANILPWTLGDCFAQVSGLAQPGFLFVV
jgi:PAS fold